MDTLTVKELRNDTSKVIESVVTGSGFVVTRHGVPVATLTPCVAATEQNWKTLLGPVAKLIGTFPPDELRNSVLEERKRRCR